MDDPFRLVLLKKKNPVSDTLLEGERKKKYEMSQLRIRRIMYFCLNICPSPHRDIREMCVNIAQSS